MPCGLCSWSERTGEQHLQEYAASRSTSAGPFTAYNETYQNLHQGLLHFSLVDRRAGLLSRWKCCWWTR